MSTRPSLDIRPSAIAGTWYPGSAAALRQTIEQYLDRAERVALPGRIAALVSPHAGYAYSGGVAAHAYAQIRGMDFERIVLLGPLHRPVWGSRHGPAMVPAEDAYATPLGQVRLDDAFIGELSRRISLTRIHGDEEHSLEIQLPFLQVALGEFTLVPVMLGLDIADAATLPFVDALAEALADLVDEHTLIVASTDLSHLDHYADVVRIDRRLVELVGAFDVDGLARALQTDQVYACGAVGLVAALKAARRLGARGARVLRYASSGDVTGEKRPGNYTVGYLAAAAHL